VVNVSCEIYICVVENDDEYLGNNWVYEGVGVWLGWWVCQGFTVHRQLDEILRLQLNIYCCIYGCSIYRVNIVCYGNIFHCTLKSQCYTSYVLIIMYYTDTIKKTVTVYL